MVQLNKGLWLLSAGLFVTTMVGCKDSVKTIEATAETEFEHKAESFADLQILKYEVPGWEDLTLQQKELAYYLYEAALAGRDIINNKKEKINLMVKKVLNRFGVQIPSIKTPKNGKLSELIPDNFGSATEFIIIIQTINSNLNLVMSSSNLW